jgi:hypothetical protein
LRNAGWLPEIENTEDANSKSEEIPDAEMETTAAGPSSERLAELAAIRAGWPEVAQNMFAKLRAALNDERRGYAGYLLGGFGQQGLTRKDARILIDQLVEIGEGHLEAFVLLEKALQDFDP